MACIMLLETPLLWCFKDAGILQFLIAYTRKNPSLTSWFCIVFIHICNSETGLKCRELQMNLNKMSKAYQVCGIPTSIMHSTLDYILNTSIALLCNHTSTIPLTNSRLGFCNFLQSVSCRHALFLKLKVTSFCNILPYFRSLLGLFDYCTGECCAACMTTRILVTEVCWKANFAKFTRPQVLIRKNKTGIWEIIKPWCAQCQSTHDMASSRLFWGILDPSKLGLSEYALRKKQNSEFEFK